MFGEHDVDGMIRRDTWRGNSIVAGACSGMKCG